MPLNVHAFGAYASYSRDDIPWRDVDYQINKLVKALKQDPERRFPGHGVLSDGNGNRRQFTFQQPANAFFLFASWGAARLRQLGYRNVVIVPVPSSRATVFGFESAPARMARALQVFARNEGAEVGHWLRFAREMPSASKAGGSRNVGVIESELIASPSVQNKAVVLVDDVKTTGAHLKACANVLRNAGADVGTVLVAATTVWFQHPTPLNVEPEDLQPPAFTRRLRFVI